MIAGRELTGDFEPTAAPLYLWLRKDGELQLISGCHRFAKLMEDGAVTDHPCYVFVEGESFAGVTFDERWARMMDFENNMRDDQADEVTAAIYARETGYSDEYMRKKGLLRNGSKAKRGIYIGRQAGDELFTRVRNGAVSPMDAEIICRLTAPIKDRTRVADIQVTCCTLLEQKKSWEYIGGMAQLLANKEAVTLKQGLLDLGADFEADMDRMAKFVERNLQSLAEAIGVLKGDRKLAKKGGKATRLGVSAQLSEEERERRIADLERIKSDFEFIGSNPDLIAQAQLWDGKTEIDPVARYLEQAAAQREQEARESGMDAGEYLEEQAAKQAAAEAVPSLFGSMSLIMGERGAARLTEAVEVLGNLRTARGILGRRKWHKLTRQEQVKIKLATGWEQDAEGHWVMEAPDLNQVFPEPDVRFMDAAERAYQEHCEAAEEATRIWEERKGKELTAAERKRYDDARRRRDDAWREYKRQRERYRKSGLPKGPLKIEDFIKGTPYEEAYPELKGIKVECRVLRGCAGYFSPLENAICIDKDCVEPRVKLGIALHEVQHVIQDIEGWGKGGDASLLGKENYRRLTGEVAARNAERRTYMPVGERNLLGELGEYQALLEDTEDVARENQLVRDSHNTLRGGLQAVGDLRMSFSGISADEVYSAWSARVQHFIQNPPPSGSSGFRRDMTVCPTPAVFRMLGLKQFDIAVTPAVLAKAIDADEVYGNGMRNADFYKDVKDVAKHGLKLEDLPKLPGQLADPVCVTVSDTPGCVEVVTEIMDRGDNVLVAVKIGTGTSNDVEANIHRIKSLYGKESIERLLTHPVLYWNKAKARIWMKNGGLQLPTTPHLTAGFRGTILKPADLVKYKNQHGIGFSTVDMEVASTRALALLEGRADEAYAVEMAKRFRRKLEALQLFRLGDGRDEALRLGRGAQLLAELTGLVDSAEAVLGQAAHTGRLAGLLRWCRVYAQMMQEGRAPAGGELKGGLFDEFTARMRKMQEGARLNGLTEDEVRETMASYAGERLDMAFDKVARHVVECLDGFVKGRARERMDYIREHVYPKREEGQRWPRGKMSADAYRRVERVYQLMEMDSERVATLMESAKRELAELQGGGGVRG